MREFKEPPLDPAEQKRWQQLIQDAADPVAAAIVDFGREADRYVYGPEPV